MKKIFVHLGPHKTGTTALQRAFINCSQLNLYPRHETTRRLLAPFWFYDKKEVQSYLNREYNPGLVNIISDEELSGNIHNAGNGGFTFEILLSRLSQVQGIEFVFIITKRDTAQLLLSSWRQYIKKGGKETLTNYYLRSANNPNYRLPKADIMHFNIESKIKLIEEHFGKEAINIVEYNKECLGNSFLKILNIGHLKVDNENVSAVIHSYHALRLINYLCSVDQMGEGTLIRSGVGKTLAQLKFMKIFKFFDPQLPQMLIIMEKK